ncbi:unnamed protein product, partial [Phaeothamnion confervicola]
DDVCFASEEARRVLKDGGALVLAVPEPYPQCDRSTLETAGFALEAELPCTVHTAHAACQALLRGAATPPSAQANPCVPLPTLPPPPLPPAHGWERENAFAGNASRTAGAFRAASRTTSAKTTMKAAAMTAAAVVAAAAAAAAEEPVRRPAPAAVEPKSLLWPETAYGEIAADASDVDVAPKHIECRRGPWKNAMAVIAAAAANPGSCLVQVYRAAATPRWLPPGPGQNPFGADAATLVASEDEAQGEAEAEADSECDARTAQAPPRNYGRPPCFYDWRAVAPALGALLAGLPVITDEAAAAGAWAPWPEQHFADGGARDWTVLPFAHTFPAHDASRLTWVPSTCRRCPHTAALLASIPGLRTALLSRLGTGTRLSAHRGWADLANHVLRCHIPIVPSGDVGCGLWVEGARRRHRVGEVLVFDDSRLHRAFNESAVGGDRVVLIVDLVRPPSVPLGTAKGGHTAELDGLIDAFK